MLRTAILRSVRLPLFGTTLLLTVVLLGACVAITVFAAPSRHTTAVALYQNVRSATLNAPFGATRAVIALVAAGICFTLDHLLNRWVRALGPLCMALALAMPVTVVCRSALNGVRTMLVPPDDRRSRAVRRSS
ncbi:MAG: hypothetical protein AAF913_18930 [Pseudomonadota bacterium]